MIRRAIAGSLVVWATLAAVLPAAGHESKEKAMDADPERVTWQELRYEASKFFVTAETTATFEKLGRGKVVIGVETEALGKRTTDDVTLDAKSARTLEREKRQYRKDPYAKTYRFQRQKIVENRRAPAGESEREKAPAKWTKRSETVHQPETEACQPLADPTALLYIASARRWEVGGPPVALCIFSDETFSRMTIRAVETAEIEVDYALQEAGGLPTTRTGKIQTVVLQIDVASLDGTGGQSTFEVLGLKEDVRFHLDPEHRVPVLITGKMDVVGNVEIELQRATLR